MATPDQRNKAADLVNQWERLVNYEVTVPEWMLEQIAVEPGIQSLFALGQFMNHRMPLPTPWAQYGLDFTQYQQAFNTANDVYLQMAGEPITQGSFDTLMILMGGQITAAGMQAHFLHDWQPLASYPWLKYGLDFAQFQQQKLGMQVGLGATDVSNAQAILQLQYTHRYAGQNMGVSSQPTLTQQEKKTADTGVSQSEVR